ncbi:hypothetical protein ACLEPN_22010 [Myxococcus sp. 1LA]
MAKNTEAETPTLNPWPIVAVGTIAAAFGFVMWSNGQDAKEREAEKKAEAEKQAAAAALQAQLAQAQAAQQQQQQQQQNSGGLWGGIGGALGALGGLAEQFGPFIWD